MCAVSKITLQELKGDYFYSVQDAYRFIVKNWHAIVFTPSTIFAILVFYAMATSFFAFLSKAPLVGSLFLAIPFAIYLFGAIFAVFTLYTFIVSILLSVLRSFSIAISSIILSRFPNFCASDS